MGRHRKRNLDLPTRMSLEHGAYYYRPPGTRRRVHLGADRDTALAEYRRMAVADGVRFIPLDIARVLHERARKNARARRIDFQITRSYVTHLMVECEKRCAVSGLPLDVNADGRYALNPWGPSIDRIDSTKGYVEGNCRIVAVSVNVALNQWGLETLLKIAESIAQRRGKLLRVSIENQ